MAALPKMVSSFQLQVLARPLGTLTLAFGVYILYKLASYVFREIKSPIRDLPGPPNPSVLYGNFKELFEGDSATIQEKWVDDYGDTLQYRGLFCSARLFTTDLKALNHILVNSYDYHKPPPVIYNLRRIIGNGVLTVEEDQHKFQRNIMNPAFGPRQIRELTEIFVEKSVELRDIWAAEAAKQDIEGTGSAKVDALSWLSRFDYKFDALSEELEKNELSKAFAGMMKTGKGLEIIPILRGIFPILRFLKNSRDIESEKASETMFRVGAQLIQKSKAAMARDVDKRTSGRDLLSLLLRANITPGLSANQTLDDTDVLAQIPTFLAAGHETTSVATTWALYALTQNKAVQTKLREELARVSTDNPTMDELNSLPYLDAFVRETLRVHAPVPATIRQAMKDDYLPLSKPFIDRHGKLQTEIRISKGTILTVPIVHINRAKSLWGEDALEFKPERWEKTPSAVSSVPGIWGNLMTFLGGPRACIGYRFSLVETKALLFTLVRAFEFDLAVPGSDIVKKSGAVVRPLLITDHSNQLPVIIRPVAQN